VSADLPYGFLGSGRRNADINLVGCNKGNSNGVGDWEILLLLLVAGSVSMIFLFL